MDDKDKPPLTQEEIEIQLSDGLGD